MKVVHSTKNGMTVSITNHIVNERDHIPCRKGQLYYTKNGITVKSGFWMDFTEDCWGISDSEYYNLPVESRMQLEAEHQHTYDIHKQYIERFKEQGETKELFLLMHK